MGFLGNIFKRKVILPPADISVLHTDVHSHFIPGIDDGAKTVEESIELITAMAELGYKKVITTPHIMSDYYRNTPEIILGGLQVVREAIKKAGLDITIDAAAEYYLDEDFERKIDSGNILTFGSNYVLFELPFISEPPMLKDIIFKLQTSGYKPVLAHVERYTFWYNNFDNYINLKERGVIFQLNFNSLTGYYSMETKKISEKLIDNGMIELIGSDCHRMDHIDVMHDCLKQEYLHKLLASGVLLNSTL